MDHVNNTSKPLVFVGTNNVLHLTVATCKQIGYTIAGVIDDDYHGQGHFQDIPVIAKEQDLIDHIAELSQYQFICTTNWQPPEVKYPQHIRNKKKRERFIALLEQSGLDIASVIHPTCQYGNYHNTIGKGVIIEAGSLIAPYVTIDDWSTILQWVGIGDGTSIGKNCVLQRGSVACGDITIEDNCYIGMSAKLFRDGTVVGQGTFIHPGLSVMRDTQPNEVISLAGKDLRRVYSGT
jgi:carbonic anhydrase/acetyltransferase-like protein (isoleucine patch superfamily)